MESDLALNDARTVLDTPAGYGPAAAEITVWQFHSPVPPPQPPPPAVPGHRSSKREG